MEERRIIRVDVSNMSLREIESTINNLRAELLPKEPQDTFSEIDKRRAEEARFVRFFKKVAYRKFQQELVVASNERPSVTLVRVLKRTKEKYGMYAADWYVCGYDANNKYYEGWESDFLYEKQGDGIR